MLSSHLRLKMHLGASEAAVWSKSLWGYYQNSSLRLSGPLRPRACEFGDGDGAGLEGGNSEEARPLTPQAQANQTL